MIWYGLHISTEIAVQIVLLLSLSLGIVRFLVPNALRFRFASRWRSYKKQDRLVRAASSATIVLAVILIALFGFPTCIDASTECQNKFWYLLHGPPNEIGDTIAGIASALAFLWIIVAVLLQSKELSAQRHELEQMRSEYARQNLIHENNLELLKKEHDRVHRNEMDKLLLSHIKHYRYAVSWHVKRKPVIGWIFKFSDSKQGKWNELDDIEFCAETFFALKATKKAVYNGKKYQAEHYKAKLGDLVEVAEKATKLETKLSSTGSASLDASRLRKSLDILKELDERYEEWATGVRR